MNFLPSPIRALGLSSVQQPVSIPVAGNTKAYLEEIGINKLGWRAFRRELVYRWSQQDQFRIDKIPRQSKRGLWMYFGVPQIGDALMDLAPRSIFRELGVEIDLLVEPPLAQLFEGDAWFSKVLPNEHAALENSYDFVIVPSYKNRSLGPKAKLLPQSRWTSLHERFTGPEFHRARFATQRLVDLFGLQTDETSFSFHAKQKIRYETNEHATSLLKPCTVALALGGVDAYRTYEQWVEVVNLLVQDGWKNFLLLGSPNGRPAAEAICASGPKSSNMLNMVGQTNLRQCHFLLSQSKFAIAADGGLMHLAVAANTPVVSLFQSTVHPQWRLPSEWIGAAIQSTTSRVNDIPAYLVQQRVRENIAWAP
jgi:ADP-heptose:LPS heptosyltransferase